LQVAAGNEFSDIRTPQDELNLSQADPLRWVRLQQLKNSYQTAQAELAQQQQYQQQIRQAQAQQLIVQGARAFETENGYSDPAKQQQAINSVSTHTTAEERRQAAELIQIHPQATKTILAGLYGLAHARSVEQARKSIRPVPTRPPQPSGARDSHEEQQAAARMRAPAGVLANPRHSERAGLAAAADMLRARRGKA
jgi:hypothetical protein